MSHTLTEGGQITSHRFRMFKQVIKITFLGSFFLCLCLFGILMYSIPKIVYVALWYYLKAWILQGSLTEIEVNHDFLTQAAGLQYHFNPHLPPAYITKLSMPIVQKLLHETYIHFMTSVMAFGVCFIGILSFFLYRGRLAKEKKHLLGPKITSPFFLKWRLKINRKNSPIKIGSLPLVKGTETQHILISGGTGSGKTNCLHHLLQQIRTQKQKAIIVDTTGIFVERYFREKKDILLNPFDQRGSPWNPWAEGNSASDYASIAEAFIPNSYSDNENYWRVASKSVFVSLLEKFSDIKKTSEITRWIQYETLENLCKLVKGTKAAAHMDLSSEKTASSIRSVSSTFLECLESMEDTSTPFSIRDWLTKEDDSWLFLQCTPAHRTILRPLMTAWISSAIRGLLILPIDLNRRIWFSIDELPTLHRVKDLETLLTEGRKYGGCGIITLQSPAQIENIYGRDTAKTIIGNTATKIIFRERDHETAERISRAFGEREIMEIQEGISYGAHEARDGVSLSMQNKIRPVVSASQILELPVNSAYVKLADENCVAQIRLPLITDYQR